MTIEQLQGSLQAYEEKHKKKKEITENLFKMQLKEKEESQRNERSQQSQGKGRGQFGRGYGARGSNFTGSSYEKGETSTIGHGRGYPNTRYEKSQTQCYNCQKFGHYAAECRFSKNRVEEKTNYVKEKDEKFETVLLARGSNEGIHENSWCLDIGARNHMCGKGACSWSLMNQYVAMSHLAMIPRFQ